MPTEITMPRLSDTMSEGTVAKWRKQVGEQVAKGDILVEIETDKATMELEAFQQGVMGKILVPEGQTVPIGVPIALLVAPGEQVPADGAGAPTAAPQPGAQAPATAQAPTPQAPAAAQATPAPAPAAPAPSAPAQPAEPALPSTDERLRASPLARRIARERGIDLRSVRGTGPSGRIVRADVEQHARAAAAAPQPSQQVPAAAAFPGLADEEQLEPLTGMQQTIVRRMLESKDVAPHFYVTVEIDMTEAVALRKSINAALEGEANVTFNDFVVKAAALTLKKHPIVNSSFRDGRFVHHTAINVGIAVAIPDGLVVPVVRNADVKGVRQISEEARALIDRARNRQLSLAEMEGSTFSITNLGMYEVDQFTGIINQPNAGILAVGSIQRKPVVKDDQIVIADRMRVTMSCDHRVIYGAHAAEFLRDLKRLLERPLLLLA